MNDAAGATSKALARRLRDPMFRDSYFVGAAIDIGPGPDSLARQTASWPKLVTVRDWDLEHGDATDLRDVAPRSFDLVYSSHCLEHIRRCEAALGRWWDVLRPDGCLVLVVPDEDLYEQGFWPPAFNSDHKHSFTIQKARSWSPVSVNLTTLLGELPGALIIKLERIEEGYDFSLAPIDQTAIGPAESSIECILRKIS